MKIAILASNKLDINESTKKGTEIFVRTLVNTVAHLNKDLKVTVFCSKDSDLTSEITSLDFDTTSPNIPEEKHIIFELALLSKAFSIEEKFDLYHANIGDGDIILPFALFVKKPILITIHNTLEAKYVKSYFSFFKNLPNLFFVSSSEVQRALVPGLNFVATIPHGVDIENEFKFDPTGGNDLMWVGRVMPGKGLETSIKLAKVLKKRIHLFGIFKEEYSKWLQIEKLDSKNIKFDTKRQELIAHYQSSKLLLFPTLLEESFGLVMIEALACGTPVVAFAKGAVPEVTEDGKTGFIVNSSENDIRGNWIIKKTGFEGLREAVEKIYSMSQTDYLKMRADCRALAEKSFSAKRMAQEYLKVYKTLSSQ